MSRRHRYHEGPGTVRFICTGPGHSQRVLGAAYYGRTATGAEVLPVRSAQDQFSRHECPAGSFGLQVRCNSCDRDLRLTEPVALSVIARLASSPLADPSGRVTVDIRYEHLLHADPLTPGETAALPQMTSEIKDSGPRTGP